MFSKSKRFDDKPVGCGADAAYNPKELVKPIGGVIPKVDRFQEPKYASSVHSDTESVQSEKIFRTPKSVRRVALTHIKSGSKASLDEYLETKNSELRNKDETIKEYELQVKDLGVKLYLLENELKNITGDNSNNLNIIQGLQVEICELKERYDELEDHNRQLSSELHDNKEWRFKFEERDSDYNRIEDVVLQIEEYYREVDLYDSLSLVDRIGYLKTLLDNKTSEISKLKILLSQANAEIKKLYESLEFKNEELKQIDELKNNIMKLEEQNEELNLIDEKRSLDILGLSDLVNANKALCGEYLQRLEVKNEDIKELTEELAMVKGQHALALEANESIRHEYKVEIDSLVFKHTEELYAIECDNARNIEEDRRCYNEELNELEQQNFGNLRNLEEDYESRIKHMEESAAENARISEMQYAELQINSRRELDEERRLREQEADVCRSMIEKYERCVMDLNERIRSKDDELNSLDERMKQLSIDCETKEQELERLQSQPTVEDPRIVELKNEIEALQKEKCMYSVSLKSHRDTIAVLKARLCKSDEDVVYFKNKLDELTKINETLNEECVDLKIELNTFKDEYNYILTTLVESKTVLDKNNDALKATSEQLMDDIELMKDELIENVKHSERSLKSEIDAFVAKNSALIDELRKKSNDSDQLCAELKKHSSMVHSKVVECQKLLYNAEVQLEAKDLEINELSQENARYSGTLAAYEQEKTELQMLLHAFEKLVEDKDNKIHDYIELLQDKQDEIDSFEARFKRTTDLLEATEFIVKEKDLELFNIKSTTDEVEDLLKKRCETLQKELAEMTEKYTNLLGHQNNKQKIKHVNDLKVQNFGLKEENEKLNMTVQKQAALIERLKREVGENVLKTPLAQKKSYLFTSPCGKENRPCTPSPNKLNSPKASVERQLTPLKDLNC